MAGDADTLREYWSGHGHAGPSHGAERDAIRWGSPGDFDRCVAQVTEHGKMTPDQAKGYCNLRHHDALGYYPAQHARMEGKAYPGSQEARVPPGSATGGQWTVGADGPSTAPKKPNPYGKKGKQAKGKKGKKGKGKPPPGRPKPTAHQQHVNHQKQQAARADAAGDKAKVAQIKEQISDLQSQIKALQAKLATKGPTTKPGTKTGTKKPAGTAKPTTTTKPTTTASGKPKKTGTSGSSAASIRAQIAQLRAQIAQLQQQAIQAAKGTEPDMTKNLRNPRDRPSGKFRTFEGEAREAQHAHAEGRINDAVEYLGSARALAPEGHARFILGSLQGALARTQHVQPAIMKVGPKGWSHGWIRGVGGSDASGDYKKISSAASGTHPAVAKYEAARSRATGLSEKADKADTESAHEAARNAHHAAAGKAMTAYNALRKDDPAAAEGFRQRALAHGNVEGAHDNYAAKVGGRSATDEESDSEFVNRLSHLSPRNREAMQNYNQAVARGVPTQAPGLRDTTGLSEYEQHALEFPTPGQNVSTGHFGSELSSAAGLGYDSSGNRPFGAGMDVLRQRIGSPTSADQPQPTFEFRR